jgi:hypothetical protein
MELGETLIVTFSATATAAVLASAHLHRPLRSILAAQLRDEEMAGFWTAYSQVFTVLLPVVVVLVVVVTGAVPSAPVAEYILTLLTWGAGGLVAALGVVGFAVAVVTRFGGRPVFVAPEQADDLNRLLDRVRELRAREIVSKADALGGR